MGTTDFEKNDQMMQLWWSFYGQSKHQFNVAVQTTAVLQIGKVGCLK